MTKKHLILFYCSVIFILHFQCFAQDLENKTIADTVNYSNVINQLKLDMIKKDIEISKTNRTLGWVIAAPTAAWTILSMTALILYPPSSEVSDYVPIVLSTIVSSVLAYIGLDMVWIANYKIDKYQKQLIEFSHQTIQISNNYDIINICFRL